MDNIFEMFALGKRYGYGLEAAQLAHEYLWTEKECKDEKIRELHNKQVFKIMDKASAITRSRIRTELGFKS